MSAQAKESNANAVAWGIRGMGGTGVQWQPLRRHIRLVAYPGNYVEMTPEQARRLAKMLNGAADLMEDRQ